MTDKSRTHRRIAAALVLSAAALFLSAACEVAPGAGTAPSFSTPVALDPTVTRAPTLEISPAATGLPTAVLDPAVTPLPELTISPSATDLPSFVLDPTITPLPTAAGFEAPSPEPSASDEPLVSFGDATFAVEVADTPEERQQGLSDRPSLAKDRGMLFVYEIPYQYTFWMPRMHFPLDMIWIDGDCVVVDITRDAQPEDEEKIRTDPTYYSPRQPALYVLEVNSGIAAASGIDPGDQVSFGGSIDGKFGC